ncbi:hypothetical protein A7M79_00860 [Acinetobacter baumannii]|uniref:hypothetical protein n=1 Tax=Acinetobacter baumannii TaxID=470 RepID=UPI0008DDB672|nr:hypothetical protein [Acinetobacter baumannii]OIH12069.1 hypothetical protein A7M79_00860 [Acinetobacter baumannii]
MHNTIKHLYCKPSLTNKNKLIFCSFILVPWILVSLIIDAKVTTLLISILSLIIIIVIEFVLSNFGIRVIHQTDIDALLLSDDPILVDTVKNFLAKNNGLLTNFDLNKIKHSIQKENLSKTSLEQRKNMIASVDALELVIVKYMV